MRIASRYLGLGLVLVLLIAFGPYIWSRLQSAAHRVTLHQSANTLHAPLSDSDKGLRLACFNIAHGRGLVFDNWNGESKEAKLNRLDQIADLIAQMDADCVVLNEIDFNCTWSKNINQAAYLANKLGYPYRAEQRNLDFQIATVKWKFGNAILSKHPIKKAEVIDLPALKRWEEWLAGKKRGLLAEIAVGDQSFMISAVHLSHRSEGLRVASTKHLLSIAKDSKPHPMVIAGDLNSTPPGFPHSAKSANGENAIATFDAAQLYQRQPNLSPQPADFTFPSDQPSATIDWILIPTVYQFTDYRVWPTTLSDHLPISVEIELPKAPTAP